MLYNLFELGLILIRHTLADSVYPVFVVLWVYCSQNFKSLGVGFVNVNILKHFQAKKKKRNKISTKLTFFLYKVICITDLTLGYLRLHEIL